MVETSEHEMVRKIGDADTRQQFTSLQPTYEDTVAPDAEEEWEYED